MDASKLIWLFIMVVMMQPVISRRLVDASRKRLLAKIENKRKSRVILLAHRQETMAILGFPLVKFIDINDSEEILRAIHMTDPDVPVDLVLHTPGGLVLASLQIARAIHKHPGKVTVFVPHYAMSGGTLIALAADQIVLSPHAVLGPVDPQVGNFPAASLVKIVKEKPIERTDDETLILADQAEKAIKQIRASVLELLSDKCSPEHAEELATMLTEGRWTHDYAITFEDAKEFGLCVSDQIPEDFMKLMTLYPQPIKQQATVEYLPIRRHSPASKESA
ncbi:putative inner membrane peptidase [Roseimaritima multifibrata]|uniref:Putative inner membrane peptidase n=1 Tax=Roseimaritima multifibrata TaxID=1930274 RepID=A0A517MGX9_9BACT|nr:ATP-dependent Clp protease proteolytic subunit [Roseimaritima multifibrata]QDS94143.1 putative inner membrane peptidase [Roseimaritima multifibrata]